MQGRKCKVSGDGRDPSPPRSRPMAAPGAPYGAPGYGPPGYGAMLPLPGPEQKYGDGRGFPAPGPYGVAPGFPAAPGFGPPAGYPAAPGYGQQFQAPGYPP